MTPRTDIRFTAHFQTVKLKPSAMAEADLKLPQDEWLRLQHANKRCEAGKLYLHKAMATVEFEDGSSPQQGIFQSSMFDIDKGNGKQELKELCDAVKESLVERAYEQKIIVTDQ